VRYSGRLLTLELTETAIMENRFLVMKCLNRLKILGLTFAVDDFGIGYSSLKYIQDLPISYLKIDKSFVDTCDEVTSQAIIKAIIYMAQRLNFTIVSEGVEKKEQRDFLISEQCHLAQGKLYSMPISLNKLIAFIKKHNN